MYFSKITVVISYWNWAKVVMPCHWDGKHRSGEK